MLEYLLCVLGIYTCFLSWGILQERVSTTPYGGSAGSPPAYFKSFIVLNLFQSLAASLIGGAYLKLRGENLGRVDRSILRSYLTVAILNSLASPFGYAALRHIDYPTMILGKSCKLLPVMAASILIHRATFPRYQIVAVALVTLGVSLFMLSHDQEQPSKARSRSNSLWGLFLLLINLTIDGLTNSTQDAMFKKFPISGQQMMVMMNLTSSALMTVYLAIPWISGGELFSAFHFISSHPSVLSDILLFVLCGALGQVFIFYTLKKFGSLTLVTITVTRKMFSIILSVVLYDHHLSLAQWISVAIVFIGIFIEAFGKRFTVPSAHVPIKKIDKLSEQFAQPSDPIDASGRRIKKE